MGKVKKEVKTENTDGYYGEAEKKSKKTRKSKTNTNPIVSYDTKNHILLGEHGIKNVHSMNCLGTFPGKTEPFSVEKFKKEVKIKIISCAKGQACNTDKIKTEQDKDLLPVESRADMDIESAEKV